ncbi:MAG: CHAT domain-containing protein [Fimbriimonadales bacterium]|nr:CHAT domain-containing protein [Fimbriimonadales bacterium]
MMLATIALSLTLLEAPSLSLGFAAYVQSPPVQEQQKKEPQKPHPEVQALLDRAIARENTWKETLELALHAFAKAIEIGDVPGQALSLLWVGRSLDGLGENRKALEYYERALPLLRNAEDTHREATTLNNIGSIYFDLGEAHKALEYYNLALPVRRKAQDIRGEATTLSNIGSVYSYLGDLRKALEYYEQAFLLDTREDIWGAATTLNNIGAAYYGLGEKREALEYFELALLLWRKAENIRGESGTLYNIGSVYYYLGEVRKALEYYEQALPLMRKAEYIRGEAATLNGIGLAYSSLGEKRKALEYYEQALPLRRGAEDIRGEATTLNNIGLVYSYLGIHQQAIWRLKQSVNLLQSLRAQTHGLDPSLQQSFTESVKHTYQILADILTEEGRILEAQQVLNLLKDDELYQYIRRTEESLREKRVDYTPAEEKWSAEYEEISKGITAIGKEARELLQIKERSPEQQSKLDELNAKLEAANAKFQEFLDRVVAESSNLDSKTNRLEKVREAEALASTLARMPEGTVAVWTAISEKSLTLIVVTPNASVGRRVEIDIAEFQKKLLAFRQALSSDRFDPRPIGKEIYDLLVKPIQEDLIGANAKTIMWSLDGSLRYIPIAALWDGERYMIEKYGNVIFTAAAMSRLERDPLQSWTGVALGLTKEVDVEDPVIPGRKIRFVALPGVEFELSSVKGSMPGTDALLDDKFTIDELKRRLTMNPRVLHIASHFSFNPGDETRSFLVTGDGKAWTVAEVRSLPTGALESVAVLALSACDTALGLGADGSEVEGFAAWMQKKGAESVLATLWPVADPTTAAVMSEFYRLKISNPTWTKLQALHEAQMGLLLGRLEVEGAEVKRMEPAGKPPEGLELPVFVAPKNAPFSHPYYWAPFILAGNWR